MNLLPTLLATCWAALAVSAACAQGESRRKASTFDRVVAPFLRNHCVGCHGEREAENDVRLDTLRPLSKDKTHRERWELVLEMLSTDSMPPGDEPQPDADDKAAVTAWIEKHLEQHPAKPETQPTRRKPNIVLIFTDDQGYGDLGCYGSTTVRTPRLDALAKAGTRFTSCYVQVVCGPSRSALLTGRYPVRSHGWSMPASEITIAERLRTVGYRTACIGKWDVSNRRAIVDRMPNAQGFDEYWGTLGANDSGRVQFHHDNAPAGGTADMASLTRLYTDKAIGFMQRHKDRPFFLYLAHTMVHSVIDASPAFRGKSKGGLYGDTIEELDHHTGRLLDAIDTLGLRKDTLVMFLSDNGPWNNMQKNLRRKHKGAIAWGSSGPLRAGKGSTYEGGLRVPCILRWPGHVPAGRVSDAIFASLDLMPTFATLAGYEVPKDRILDGVDQTPLLLGKSEQGARDDYFYFCRNELHAVRKGRWKLRLPDLKVHYGYVKDKGSGELELYDLDADIGERTNLAAQHRDVVAKLQKHAASFVPPKVRLENHRIDLRGPQRRKQKK